jgi:hypothetical protein
MLIFKHGKARAVTPFHRLALAVLHKPFSGPRSKAGTLIRNYLSQRLSIAVFAVSKNNQLFR